MLVKAFPDACRCVPLPHLPNIFLFVVLTPHLDVLLLQRLIGAEADQPVFRKVFYLVKGELMKLHHKSSSAGSCR